MKIPAFNKSQNNDFYHDNLSQVLLGGVGENGFSISQQTTDNIAALASSMPSGTMLYDSDTNQMKVIINGVVKTFTVT